MDKKQVFGPEEISLAVRGLAARINEDYKGLSPVLICVLKGSIIFFSDLVRCLDMPVELEFIRASSYGGSTDSSGVVRITTDIEADIKGRDVILVDDILDTGYTINRIVEHLEAKEPSSVKTCVLLDKPSRRIIEQTADYAGLVIGDIFIVGYGLDYSERFRNLPGLCELTQSERCET